MALDDFASVCVFCSNLGRPALSWKIATNGALALRAACAGCGEFQKWLPQTKGWLELAPPKPSDDEIAAAVKKASAAPAPTSSPSTASANPAPAPARPASSSSPPTSRPTSSRPPSPWLDDLRALPPAAVADALGLKGVCPSCRAVALTFSENRWRCGSCPRRGDAVDLLVLEVTGGRSHRFDRETVGAVKEQARFVARRISEIERSKR
jgi:hypothetical protein